MRSFNLDARLAAIAELVPQGARLWDVGSDHGRLPAWLLSRGKIETAVASDIAEGPLESARTTARRYGVFDNMRFVLCDGLPPEAGGAADTVVIAGMGGGTIAEILRAAPWTRDGVSLILQPMSSPEDLRDMLYGGGYAVTGECFVRDGRHGYVIITACGGALTERQTSDERFQSAERLTLAERLAGRFIDDEEHIRRVLYHLNNKLLGDNNAEYVEAIRTLEGKIHADNRSNIRKVEHNRAV